MDEVGDAEGNYTLVARRLIEKTTDQYELVPIGTFQLSSSKIPVSTSRDRVR